MTLRRLLPEADVAFTPFVDRDVFAVGDAPAVGAEPGGRRRQPDVSRAAREPGRR